MSERGRRTALTASNFITSSGGLEALSVPRPEGVAGQWFRIAWACDVVGATAAASTWAPMVQISHGVGNGVLTFEADGFAGSVAVLVESNIRVNVVESAPTALGDEGGVATPTQFNVIATEIYGHEQAQATRTYYETVANGGTSQYYPRPNGALTALVGSTQIGAARALVLLEVTDPAGVNVVARSDVMAGTVVRLGARTRYLAVRNAGAVPDDISIICPLDAA